MKKLTSVLLLLALGAQAEMNPEGNPAFVDRMEAVRLNPALAAWQPLAFSADWRSMHAGILDSPFALQEGGFHFTIPRHNLVLLADYRDTDLLQESELMVNWAWRPRGDFSLGVELGARYFGWNRDRLGVDVLQDPVFADGTDRWQPLLGLGAFWSPWVGVQAGLSLKRLNRPILGLQDDDSRAPVRLRSGVVWKTGQLRLGLSADNLRYLADESGIASGLVEDLQGALQVGWLALDGFEILTELKLESFSLDFRLQLMEGHEFGYQWVSALGDLAEQSHGSHALRYRYSLGGGLLPAGTVSDQPEALPSDRWQGGNLSDLLGRRWSPEDTPCKLRSLHPHLEMLELHVHVDTSLSRKLLDSKMSPQELALSGLFKGGRKVQPEQSGVVRESYSPAWWQLSGWLEELAWDEGLHPVVHVGETSARAEDLANLLGAPLEERGSGALNLPGGDRLLMPDTLRFSFGLEAKLEEQAGNWQASIQLPGGEMRNTSGRGAPPERIELPLAGLVPGTGDAAFLLEVFDESGRLMIHRGMDLPVVLRVRRVHLSERRDDIPSPSDVDGIHLHLNE